MLTLAQTGQTSVDLYMPVKRSAMTESSRFLVISQTFAAISRIASGLLTMSSVESGFSMYGFFLTRLKSSWRPSRRNPRNSWESCWPYPENEGAYLPMVVLKNRGATEFGGGSL